MYACELILRFSNLVLSFSDKYQSCGVCNKLIHKHSLARHMKSIHSGDQTVQCEYCDAILKNLDTLQGHHRKQHGIYKSKNS